MIKPTTVSGLSLQTVLSWNWPENHNKQTPAISSPTGHKKHKHQRKSDQEKKKQTQHWDFSLFQPDNVIFMPFRIIFRSVSRTWRCLILQKNQVQWTLQCWFWGDLQLLWWSQWNYHLSKWWKLESKAKLHRSVQQQNISQSLRFLSLFGIKWSCCSIKCFVPCQQTKTYPEHTFLAHSWIFCDKLTCAKKTGCPQLNSHGASNLHELGQKALVYFFRSAKTSHDNTHKHHSRNFPVKWRCRK